MNEAGNPLMSKSIQFSIELIAYVAKLNKGKGWGLSNQLLRSGTSIGAQVCEAQDSQSRKDFIHKIKIAAQEAKESRYWLLLSQVENSNIQCEDLLILNMEIIKLTGKILATAINNQNGKSQF